MVAVCNNIGVGRDTQVWVVPETVFGTFAVPDSTHSVLISDGGTFNQVANLIEDAQKRPIRSRFAQIRGKYDPADWSFTTYFKPQTPVASAANNEHLLEGLLGRRDYSAIANGSLIVSDQTGVFQDGEAVTGSVSGAGTLGIAAGGLLNLSAVTTGFADDEVITGTTSGATATVYDILAGANVAFTPGPCPLTYSIYANVGGHTTLMVRGATINQGVFTVNGVDIANVAWTGQAIEMRWTGTSQLTAVVTATATTCIVTDASLFSIDSLIQIQDSTGIVVDDNAGAGYHVSNVDETTNTLTIDSAGGFDIGDATGLEFIGPWLPDSIESGTVVHGRQGAVSLDNATLSVTDSSITINNNISYVTDEKDGSDFASIVTTPGMREVSGSVSLYFRAADTKYFATGRDSLQAPVQINLGTAQNQRFAIYLPSSVFTIPTLDTGDMISLSTELRAEASNAEVPGEIVILGD